jgi:hypothetical protein
LPSEWVFSFVGIPSEILEGQLHGWYHVPSAWPNARDPETLDCWFEWSSHPTVVDLSDDPLLQ